MSGPPTYSFETPEPISAELDISLGGARIVAGPRDTTVVEVRPSSDSRRSDVEAAGSTRVEFAAGRLEVRGPKPRYGGLIGKPGAIEVVVQLPAGSQVRGNSAYGDFEAQGRLGDCFFKTSYGTLRVEDTAALILQTSAGSVTVGRVGGVAEITSSWGDVRIGETLAPAALKTSGGDIRVEKAGDCITARTAYGGIRIGEAAVGELDLTTSYGDIEVGVAEGSATFLELTSHHGGLRNHLEPVEDAPGPGDLLKVSAQTNYGDIRVFRAQTQAVRKGG